jgi:hypothetical protein
MHSRKSWQNSVQTTYGTAMPQMGIIRQITAAAQIRLWCLKWVLIRTVARRV